MSTLTILIVVVFCVGYLCIALESLTRVNKAAIALLMCVICWTLLMMGPAAYYPEVAEGSVVHHIAEVIEHHLGDAAGTLFFLMGAMTIVEIVDSNGGFILNLNSGVNLICALVTLTVIIICSVYGKKMAKMIPFIIGICAGYLVALCFTLIGNATANDALKILSFDAFSNMKWIPEFTFLKAFSGGYDYGEVGSLGKYIAVIAVAYIPVAFVVFAEHIADHKNLSSIIEADLLDDPGLHRTLLGDGIGSMAGAFFGGCPNTTYGESVGCVAISGNASVVTTVATAALAIVASFIAPFTTFLATIPTCVMGGVCITLYGFIAVSGLKMLQKVDLDKNRNLFPASIILICGVGGMRLVFGQITVTSIAVALILGILANVILAKGEKKEEAPAAEKEEKSETET